MTLSLQDLLRSRDGLMTEELVLRPGDFGLGRVPARLQPAATAPVICGFCSTGCSLRVHLDARGQAINLTPDPDYPVNLGLACPKGWEALAPLASPDRATTPLLRGDDGVRRPVDWERALTLFAARWRDLQSRHGQACGAVLSSGQIVTEEMALLGALAKFGLGVVDLDSNTRQCMATSHVAYKESFGFDAPPYTYADFEESDVLVFIGANPCVAHPILWQRVCRNRRSPQIVVIDPRKTETAQAATLHLPLAPKSDLALLYGLARLLLDRGRVDRAFVAAHTEGFEGFAGFLADFPLERTASATGLPPGEIVRLAEAIGGGGRVSFWWTMGVNQSHESTRTAQAVINLALMTGNLGRPGTGANSITGQCNAMGSRLFANATSLLGGYDFASGRDRLRVGEVLGIDPAVIPDRPGRAYDQIIDAAAEGEIRALWIVGTDPAHSWIDRRKLAAARRKLDFLVVQDMYANTETASMADLFLPAAGWGEKTGVLINSERRLGLVKKVSRAPGQALSDFAIFKLVAQYTGCGSLLRRWSSPEAVFGIMKELSRGQPCDFTGIRDYAHLEEAGGIQWPCTAADAAAGPVTERRLFADGRFFTASGRARFVHESPRPEPHPPTARFPFRLLTGRGTSAQWHTGSRTSKSAVLRSLSPDQLQGELHPDDAVRVGVTTGDQLVVTSARGEVRAVAAVTSTISPGNIFLPMHDGGVNALLEPVFDPYSRQPSYKACPVAVRRG